MIAAIILSDVTEKRKWILEILRPDMNRKFNLGMKNFYGLLFRRI